MKIYTYIKINIETLETIEEEYFEYNGPIACCADPGADLGEGQHDPGDEGIGDDDLEGDNNGLGLGGRVDPAGTMAQAVGTVTPEQTGLPGVESEEAGAKGFFGNLFSGILGQNFIEANKSKALEQPTKSRHVNAARQSFGLMQKAEQVPGSIMGVLGLPTYGLTKAYSKSIDQFKNEFGTKSKEEQIQALAGLYSIAEDEGTIDFSGTSGSIQGTAPGEERGNRGLTGSAGGRSLTSAPTFEGDLNEGEVDALASEGYSDAEISFLKNAPLPLRDFSPYLMHRLFPTYFSLLYNNDGVARQARRIHTPTPEKRAGFDIFGIGEE